MKRRGTSTSNSSEDSDDDDWHFNDSGVDYGSPEKVSDGS